MQPLMASPCPGIKYRVLPQPSRPYLVWSLTTCLTSYPGTSSLVHTYKHRTIPSAPGKSQACSHLRAFAHAAPSVYSLLPLLKPGSFGSFRFPLKHHLQVFSSWEPKSPPCLLPTFLWEPRFSWDRSPCWPLPLRDWLPWG